MSGMLASTAAAVGIIDKAVGIAKKLADDGGELDKATFKLELASVKMEVITTQALLFDAEQKIKDLEEKLKDKIAFSFRDGVFWTEGDDTAFCPKCYESENKKIHMELRERAYAGLGSFVEKSNWYCRVCKTAFNRK